MENTSEYDPCAKQIVDVKNGLFLNMEVLEEILLQDDIKEKKVCIISIAGAFRQGKSFLLNFFVRYLTVTSCESTDITNWLDSESAPIRGFLAKGGSTAVTTGILIWSQVFLRKLSSGEEIAVVLIDTQGSFDNESTLKSCTEIFALSSLISSVQIYNLKENIKRCDLDYLKLFVEYGRLLMEAGTRFQHLLFLIRDWTFPEEKPYGFEGGKLLLDCVLNVEDDNVNEENISLRRDIKELFDSIDCFLLPHPGFKVTKFMFAGELKDIEEDFKTHVNGLISTILSPDNLVPKVIDGQFIKVKHLVHLFKSYCEQFRNENIPKMKSFTEVVANIQHMMALEEAETLYDVEMDFMKNEDLKAMKDEELIQEHKRSKNIAVNYFENKKMFGGVDKKTKNKAKLEAFLEKKFAMYDKLNKVKQQQEKEAEIERELEEQRQKIALLQHQVVEEIQARERMKNEYQESLTKQNKKISDLRNELAQEKDKCTIL